MRLRNVIDCIIVYMHSILKRFKSSLNINFFFNLPTLIVLCLFFFIPLFIVIKISVSESIFALPPYKQIVDNIGNQLLQITINLHNYYKLFTESIYKIAILNSFKIAILSTAVTAIIGYWMTYKISKFSNNLKYLFITLISILLWMPFLIRIYSWSNILSANGIVNSCLLKIGIIDKPLQILGTYSIVWITNVICYIPFMILPIFSSLEKIDKTYIKAAYNLGASPITAFLKITLPLTKDGVITGCILVFTATMGEFIVPEILGGSNVITLGKVLWMEFFNNTDWPMACCMAIAIICMIMVSTT